MDGLLIPHPIHVSRIKRAYDSTIVKNPKTSKNLNGVDPEKLILPLSNDTVDQGTLENNNTDHIDSSDEEQVSDDSYEIEKIMDHRRNTTTGEWEFLVKWKGYDHRQNTWEPESHFDNSNTIRQYWEDVHKDN